jgi:deazaflavin-dependent oxidoreductase (nitroreductase family)
MARTYRLGPIRQAINSLMTSLIRAGLGGPANYLLTTVGRRTGRMRTTPVTVLENADGRWLVSPYGNVGWVYNVRANPEVTLQRGNRTETLQAGEVPPETAGPVLKQYLDQARITAPYFDVRVKDPVPKFVQEARQHPVFLLNSPRLAA